MSAFKSSLKFVAPALLALTAPALAVPFGSEGYIQAFGAPDPALGAPAGSVTVTCGRFALGRAKALSTDGATLRSPVSPMSRP